DGSGGEGDNLHQNRVDVRAPRSGLFPSGKESQSLETAGNKGRAVPKAAVADPTGSSSAQFEATVAS
ncbi:unnamed protein product, partial [Amoebophrya sp. A120]